MSRVSLVQAGGDIEASVRRSVDLVGGLNLKNGRKVVVKPNICNPKNPQGMVITDFDIIETVIKMAREKGGDVTVVESDNIAGPAERRITDSGLMTRLDSLGVPFLNLSRDDYEAHKVAGIELELPKTVLEADYLVNLPKIKTCAHTLVTLSIKNLYGVFRAAKKSAYHRHLDEILPYLAKTVRSDLIVVDGITCMEGNGPTVGNSRRMGVIAAGTNTVSVDSFCSRLMGFDPAGIAHIANASRAGVGEMDVDKIEVVGDDWEGFVCHFERPYSLRATLKSLRTVRDIYMSGST